VFIEEVSMRLPLIVLLLCLLGALAAGADSPPDEIASAWLDEHLDGLVEFYRELHAHPELSLHERDTAARVATRLRKAGFAVTEGVGGHGVVAVLENGKGPRLMIRGDMDGLPVVEDTGLPYASKVRVSQEDGSEVGVMHACGHDVHMANLVGTARLLAGARDRWSGTLLIVAQPAEELGRGALNMLADDLFERFGRPDQTLALHVESELPAGSVGYVSGWAMANVDSVDIVIHGRGGHGARPHMAADPIVTASYLVTALQTLVSRRLDPQSPGVVTVGSIHAGTKHNVIPDDARLQLTVRSYSDDDRRLLIDGIRQLANDVCLSFRCARPPEVTIKDEYTPAVYNDPALTARAVDLFVRTLGAENVIERNPSMGGEDFGRYARALEVPGLLYRLGVVDRKAWNRHQKKGGAPFPSLHSSRFAPQARPALATGVRSMSALALDLLARP
jgi:amidohydrolase